MDSGLGDTYLPSVQPPRDPRAILAVLDTYSRIEARAKQAQELGPWGLTRRVPDPGSSLEQDDRVLFELLPELDDQHLASGTAVFPAMAATDSASSIASLLPRISESKRLRAPSVLNLCRSAMESAARTIWLLSPTTRTERRARTTLLAGKEWYEQSKYFEHAAELHAGRLSPAEDTSRIHHVKLSAGRQKIAEAVTSTGFARPTKVIELAGSWIDAHPPEHARDQVQRFGVQKLAETTYCISSSTVHGYKWVHEHLGIDGLGLFSALADSLAMALLFTESAVALFEAHSIGDRPSGHPRPQYPGRLNSTIDAWADMYC